MGGQIQAAEQPGPGGEARPVESNANLDGRQPQPGDNSIGARGHDDVQDGTISGNPKALPAPGQIFGKGIA